MTIDRDQLLARYAAERDKRLRADGAAQYARADEQFARDPRTVTPERAPVTDDVTFAFVGGGFAGLVTGARLVEAGISDVRIVEKGGDFGGTWYWNRYPGAQCDTASMVYMPLLEETGHRPTEKYAHGPEILAQCHRIATKYGLYEHALFGTAVTEVTWDASAARWVIATDRGDRFTARFVGFGTGPLHVPKLPRISGIADFRGHSFHTSRWDYAYTGGDPDGAPLTGLADQRVAIIGTGATAVQVVPHLAAAAQQLYVVQRTPSSVDIRDNAAIDPDWFADVATPGWQRRWLENFTDNQASGAAREDWVKDGWTDLSRRIRARLAGLPRDQMTREAMLAAYEESDFEKMEEIRGRVDAVVADRATAEGLKAWYRQLCKRPCFHDEYLAAFNHPSVELVDTGGQGVERITARGFVVAGREYEVDCIVWASGFEVGSAWHTRAGFDLAGEGGVRLSEVWADGMRSLHGIHVHGFPNAFLVQPAQGANLISNVPHNLTEAAATVALIVREALDRGVATVDVTADAQAKWIGLLLAAPPRLIGGLDCTPGYYNNEGQEPTAAQSLQVGYPAGPSAYFRYLAGWRESRAFEGLEFA